MNKADEKRYEEITKRVMTDTTPIEINTHIHKAWTIAAGLGNLQHNHPGLSDVMRTLCGRIVESYSAPIIERHRRAKRLLDPTDIIPANLWMKRVAPIMADKVPITVQTTVGEVWLTIALIQMITRNPELNPSAGDRIIELAVNLQYIIADYHPDAIEVIELGWDPTHDVPRQN